MTLKFQTDEELFSAERAMIDEDPFRLVENGFLSIKTKTKGIMSLEPNPVQVKFIKKVKELFYSGKPVRVIILKARQAGLSTVIEALIYAFTSRRSGINACVIADDIDGSNYIFEMQKLYQEYLDGHLKPVIKHSNEKKLSFSEINSQILIDTAANANVGRKFTFQYVHGTEVSRWDRPLSELMLGLGHAVPQAGGTMIFLETTANGFEEFYELWCKAIKGQNDWTPLFYAWWEIPENRLQVGAAGLYPIEDMRFNSPSEKERFLLDEEALRTKYNLSDEQLNWRRWDIVNNCDGDVNTFNQENPACWEDAFIATGDLFFDRERLKRQEAMPYQVGNIVKEENRYVWRATPGGRYRLYEYPQKIGQYVVGGDPSEGLPNGDKSSAVVLNKKTNTTAMAYNNSVPPEEFEDDLIRMGTFYNNALIACENKGYGYSVNQGLFRNYGRVYKKLRTKTGIPEPTMEIGWNTNTVTRPQVLAQLAEEIKNEATELLDAELIGQCWTFINDKDKGRPQAQKGKHDDMVFARAIAGQVRLEQPYLERMFGIPKPAGHRRGLSGY